MSLLQRIKAVVALILLQAWPCLAQSAPEQFEIEPVPAQASSETVFDLAAFEALALDRNPTLVQASAQVRLSRGAALQAGLWPNPEIGYLADQIGADGTAGEFHGGYFQQDIYTGGKLQLSRAKYAQEGRQAQIQIVAQRFRILYDVRAAYYETLVRERRLGLARQLAVNAEDAAKTVQELVNVGQANRPDLLQAQVQLQRARANVQMAERRYQGAWEQLTAVAGTPGIAVASLGNDLERQTEVILDRQETLEHLLACSPELQFARAEVRRDVIGLERERVEPIPNVVLRSESGYNFESNDDVYGVQIGLKVPLFDRNQGTIMQAQAELSRAQAEVARIELRLRQRFAQVFADYEAASISAKTYRDESLPQAAELYQLYLQSFEQKRAAWPQVLDARKDYFEMAEDYLDNLLDARKAEALLTTYLLEGGLDQPPEPSPQGHRDATPRPR
jgi:cobalt-zinc-cadmium efflux system outer membrane protein